MMTTAKEELVEVDLEQNAWHRHEVLSATTYIHRAGLGPDYYTPERQELYTHFSFPTCVYTLKITSYKS
jgi:hypothetical protein